MTKCDRIGFAHLRGSAQLLPPAALDLALLRCSRANAEPWLLTCFGGCRHPLGGPRVASLQRLSQSGRPRLPTRASGDSEERW